MQTDLKRAMARALTHQEEAITTAQKTAYWLAKENVATRKFGSLMKLLRQASCPNVDKLDCGENAKCLSNQAAEEFQDACAVAIAKEIERQIQQSRFVSVLVDESTDISVTRKLVVYVRFMTEDFVPTTRFVKNPDLSDGKATAILDCLKTVLKENHVPLPVLSKVFGLGSDGASVMTGHKGGVSALMKKENPMLVNVHCLAHRLALSTSQGASDIIAKLKNYQQTINDIYCYFSKFAKRSQGLKKVQEVLESDVLKIKEVHSVRWFSFYNALYAIYHSWGALVTYFASHAESDAKAKGFLKKITEYEFIGITHFLMDIIPITTQLNLVFQKQDLDLAAVSPVVDGTVQHIKVACEQGKHQKDLKEKLKQEGSEFTLEEYMVKVSAS